jgi:hypothetical protein
MRAVPVTRDVGGQRKIGLAAHRVIRDATARGPSRDHVEVRGEAPRTHAFEQVILQHEAIGVRPVVGDLTSVVPADDIGSRATVRHGDAVRCHVTPAMFSGTGDRSPDEPRHAVVIDVEERIAVGVGSADVDELRIVERLHASHATRVGDADRRLAIGHRDPVGSRKGAEIVVERPVLLHHDDHVLDLVDALRDRRMPGQAHAESKRGERERHGENDREGSAGRSHHRSIRRPRGQGSPPGSEHRTGDYARRDSASVFAACSRHHCCPSSGSV